MNFIDLYSLALHQVVAKKMLLRETEVLQIARENHNRWLKSESFAGGEKNALLEWQEIIENSTPKEIQKIITADTDEGQRLRSSSPFAGVLSEVEREKIWNECADISPI